MTATGYFWSYEGVQALKIQANTNTYEEKYNYFMGRNATTSLSSPRAESARAFTGRRNSHSERGEDFLTGQPDFFTETAVTPERKVEKSFPRWEINRHIEG